MGLNKLFLGFIVGVTITACAGIPRFRYKYYTLSPVSYEGALLGPTPEDDKKLEECYPTSDNAGPCLVMFTTDFLKMKSDYLETKMRLIECERGGR